MEGSVCEPRGRQSFDWGGGNEPKIHTTKLQKFLLVDLGLSFDSWITSSDKRLLVYSVGNIDVKQSDDKKEKI